MLRDVEVPVYAKRCSYTYTNTYTYTKVRIPGLFGRKYTLATTNLPKRWPIVAKEVSMCLQQRIFVRCEDAVL